MWNNDFSLSNFLLKYKLVYIYSLIIKNSFIVFINSVLNNISNSTLLSLINEITKYNCVFFILNKKIVTKLFTTNFSFLDSVMSLYISNFLLFIQILQILNKLIKLNFIFSFNKFFSNITSSAQILNKINGLNATKLSTLLIKIVKQVYLVIYFLFYSFLYYPLISININSIQNGAI